jgi:hypothetical protein
VFNPVFNGPEAVPLPLSRFSGSRTFDFAVFLFNTYLVSALGRKILAAFYRGILCGLQGVSTVLSNR